MKIETIGCAPEVKPQEGRVALTPEMAGKLVSQGKRVVVGEGAGVKSGFPDALYASQGAKIIAPEYVWDESDLILQVKEPYGAQVSEIASGRYKDKTLFTYLHLASSKPLTDALARGRMTAIAYETVTRKLSSGFVDLPLLRPMSAIAGNRAIRTGTELLTAERGGPGIVLGATPDLMDDPGKVVILGGGTVGYNAAYTALGLNTEVVLFEKNPHKLQDLQRDQHLRKARIMDSISEDVDEEVIDANLVVGAVNVRGAKAPVLLRRETISRMQPGAALLDVSIDQGGNFEGSKVTTHENPTFRNETNQIFYCVSNMPGAVPRTASLYLTRATTPYVERLAHEGLDALVKYPGFANGLNAYDGLIIDREVAKEHGYNQINNPFSS